MDKKFIMVTGGTISGLGKGICTGSIAALLAQEGYSIGLIKFDGYLNVDAGTIRPEDHGEVYVLENGQETDLDLGTYYRFADSPGSKYMNITSGQIYSEILKRERAGDYLGDTVQVVPHVTNLIIGKIINFSQNVDMVLVEVGGVIADLEASTFLEALRQMPRKVGQNNCCFVHLTLVPFIPSSGEEKTKPTQHSIKDLRSIGIKPDIIICRTENKLSEESKTKISLFCDIDPEDVIVASDVDDIYKVPAMFDEQKIQERILHHLCLKKETIVRPNLWSSYENKYENSVTIGIVGKYTKCQDAYKSVEEALKHAAKRHNCVINITKINSEHLDKRMYDPPESLFHLCDGLLVPGGFGGRGLEGKIFAARWCLENDTPFFGICFGMQALVIAAARYLCNIGLANTTEQDMDTPDPVISMMEEQKTVLNMGGTMRLGNYDCKLVGDTVAWDCYAGTDYMEELCTIKERHRHRYELNNRYLEILKRNGLVMSGFNPQSNLVEIVEKKDHRFCVGVQFHPEFRSRPFSPHPIFSKFIEKSMKKI